MAARAMLIANYCINSFSIFTTVYQNKAYELKQSVEGGVGIVFDSGNINRWLN